MENRILRGKICGRVPLTNRERISLARLGKRLGIDVLKAVASIVKPETVLAWHRKLIHGSHLVPGPHHVVND